MSWATGTAETTFDNHYLSPVPEKVWKCSTDTPTQCWQKEIPGAAALSDTVTISTAHSSLLLFVSITLEDQSMMIEQEWARTSGMAQPRFWTLFWSWFWQESLWSCSVFTLSCGIQPQGWAHPSTTWPHHGTAPAVLSNLNLFQCFKVISSHPFTWDTAEETDTTFLSFDSI